MKARHILFLDDNLIGDKRHARLLFRALMRLSITWSGAASVNIGKDPELLELAYRSGCRSLFIGFESLSAINLVKSSKFQNQVNRYEEMVAAIHNHKIMINGSFIFGMDHDGPDVFQKTVDWINKNKIETATLHILTPYPGTSLYNELDLAGRIIDKNPDHYNTAHAVFKPAKMTALELELGYRRAYKSIYSWKNILNRIPDIQELRLPFFAFVLGYKKFAFITNLLSRIGLTGFLFRIAIYFFNANKINTLRKKVLSKEGHAGKDTQQTIPFLSKSRRHFRYQVATKNTPIPAVVWNRIDAAHSSSDPGKNKAPDGQFTT